MQKYNPRASWNNSEQPLLDSDSDVLAIMDSCLAGSLLSRSKGLGHDVKAYEMLCASAPHSLTEGPGPESFTAALIQALKDLPRATQDGSFTTTFLCQKLCQLRENNIPVIFNRRDRPEEQIRIAPLTAKTPSTTKTSSLKVVDQNAAYLTLKFQIRKRKLDEVDIDELTKSLPRAFDSTKVKCDRIAWVSLLPRQNYHSLRDAATKVSNVANIARYMQRSRSNTMTSGSTETRRHSLNDRAAGNETSEEVNSVPTLKVQDVPIEDLGYLSPVLKSHSRQRSRSG